VDDRPGRQGIGQGIWRVNLTQRGKAAKVYLGVFAPARIRTAAGRLA